MKKKLLLLLAGTILFTSTNFLSAQITFQKTFDGSDQDFSYSVQQTTDGGYIITGYSGIPGPADRHIYLIKTDLNGDTLWTKILGGTNGETGRFVQQTSDGGYIIAAWTYSFGAGSSDVYLIKTDANGNPLWSKTFGGTNLDQGYSVQQTTDGGYIITGDAKNSVNDNNVYLIKTDTNGDSLWTKTFGGTNDDRGYSIRQTADGGYIITGQTNSFGAGTYDVYLIKTDTNGDTLWTKTFGGTNPEYGASVQQTSDGGYIITGNTLSFGAGSDDVYLIKTDTNGDTLWTKTYGGTDFDQGLSVQQTTDGGYIIGGRTSSFGLGYADAYLIRTDGNGDTLWTKTFGGTSGDEAYSVQQTTDGGYIMAGITASFGAGNLDFYLIKTDSMGNSGCNQGSTATIVTSPATIVTNPATIVSSGGIITSPSTIVGSGAIVSTLCTTVGINETPHQEQLVLFPNPFSDKINITAQTNEPVEITLFDITSRKIFNQSFTNSTSINTSHLSKGLYIYELRNKNGVIKKGKVVKD